MLQVVWRKFWIIQSRDAIFVWEEQTLIREAFHEPQPFPAGASNFHGDTAWHLGLCTSASSFLFLGTRGGSLCRIGPSIIVVLTANIIIFYDIKYNERCSVHFILCQLLPLELLQRRWVLLNAQLLSFLQSCASILLVLFIILVVVFLIAIKVTLSCCKLNIQLLKNTNSIYATFLIQ